MVCLGPVDTSAATQLRTAGLRFLCVYFLLYCRPWPLGDLPGTGRFLGWWNAGREWLIANVGKHGLGIERSLAPFPTGSGDTTRDWVAFVAMLALALLLTTLWSFVDVRTRQPWLATLLRTGLRYVLAVALLGYGTAKFGDGQFRALEPAQLTATWGDTSPMGVVWRFMGASMAYTAFTGIVECGAGLLLLWRPTATLGGLLAAGAMTNVVLLNFCYDVPVKLYSSHLLLMALLVVAADRQRLFGVLLWHRAVPAAPGSASRWSWRWPFLLARALKWALVGWLLWNVGSGLVARLAAPPLPVSPFAGGFDVVTSVLDKEGRGVADGAAIGATPASTTTTPTWRRVFVYDQRAGGGSGFFLLARDANGASVFGNRVRFLSEPGAPPSAPPANGSGSNGARRLQLGHRWRSDDELELAVPQPDGVLRLVLRRLRREQFPLVQRGFHWVQEYPFNR